MFITNLKETVKNMQKRMHVIVNLHIFTYNLENQFVNQKNKTKDLHFIYTVGVNRAPCLPFGIYTRKNRRLFITAKKNAHFIP